MKYLLILTISFLTIVQGVSAQKMFIWCPIELTTNPKNQALKNEKIDVYINDSRILTGKVKSKCTSEELCNSVSQLIKHTYPSADINIISDKNGGRKDARYRINLNINAYYATFTSPMWFALTAYSVEIIDLISGDKKEKDIKKEKKFFNVGGFTTAKNNLNKSYLEANIDLLDFIADIVI